MAGGATTATRVCPLMQVMIAMPERWLCLCGRLLPVSSHHPETGQIHGHGPRAAQKSCFVEMTGSLGCRCGGCKVRGCNVGCLWCSISPDSDCALYGEEVVDSLDEFGLSVFQSFSLSVSQSFSLSVFQSLSIFIPQSLHLSVSSSLSLVISQSPSHSLTLSLSPYVHIMPAPQQCPLATIML